MLPLILAVVALVVAGYSAYLCRQVRNALAELADVAEDEEEESPAELWVSDGDLHTLDAAGLYEATGAIALCVSEGVPCAVVKVQGVVSLHKLLSEAAPKPASPIKRVK